MQKVAAFVLLLLFNAAICDYSQFIHKKIEPLAMNSVAVEIVDKDLNERGEELYEKSLVKG